MQKIMLSQTPSNFQKHLEAFISKLKRSHKRFELSYSKLEHSHLKNRASTLKI